MDRDLRKRFFKALEDEIKLLMDPATGMLHSDYSRTIHCPLCGAPPHHNEQLFIKNGFTFVRCRECGMMFTNPQVRSELLNDLYRQSPSNDLWVELQKSSKEQSWKSEYYLDSIRLLDRYLTVDNPRVLDIGCSTGYFLEVAGAHRSGWQLKGLELNESACELAREKGLQVEMKRLDQLDDEERFDLFTLHGVMEHLADPGSLLREIGRKVPEDGSALVLAIVPNSYSLYHMFLQEKSLSFDGRDHLIYFSEQTLRALFEQAGLNVLHLDTVLEGFDSIKRQMQWFDPNGEDDRDQYLPPSIKALFDSGEASRWVAKHNLGLRLRILASIEDASAGD